MTMQWSLLAIKPRARDDLRYVRWQLCGLHRLISLLLSSPKSTSQRIPQPKCFFFITSCWYLYFILHCTSARFIHLVLGNILFSLSWVAAPEKLLFLFYWSASRFIPDYATPFCLNFNILTLIHIFVTVSETFAVCWMIFSVSGS